MTTPTTPAWAIKAPDGHMMIVYPNMDEQTAQLNFTFSKASPWHFYYENGYRCVKVHITEAQE